MERKISSLETRHAQLIDSLASVINSPVVMMEELEGDIELLEDPLAILEDEKPSAKQAPYPPEKEASSDPYRLEDGKVKFNK